MPECVRGGSDAAVPACRALLRRQKPACSAALIAPAPEADRIKAPSVPHTDECEVSTCMTSCMSRATTA